MTGRQKPSMNTLHIVDLSIPENKNTHTNKNGGDVRYERHTPPQ